MSDDPIRSLLRHSDNLQCVLNVEPCADIARTPPDQARLADTPFHRRLIAVVTHRTHSQHTEVGSLLVVTTSVTTGAVNVIDALPITENLFLAVAQTPAPDASATNQRETPSAWLLTIRRDAQGSRSLAFIVRTRDTEKLQNLTAECRRLKEIAIAARPVTGDFAWVEVYVSDTPSHRPDLRVRSKPVHTRLSTAIAGAPGDEISDISIVRRHWVEQTAAKQASDDDVMRLKVRLGTFNVNGRVPSQDLHPWLRSIEKEKTGWISPLQLSPFEIFSDPLQQELRKKQLSTGTDVQPFGDPDVLVLGFQELDLSAEALLYATSTLKEDEWLTAIFAGLGEKRVLYEKLTSKQLVGMLIIVIVKKVLVPCFTDVRSCYAGSGIMGFMGNKGGTAIRLEFTPKTSSGPPKAHRPVILTFVNAHLAASDDMVERRNYDFQELNSRLAFSANRSNDSPPSFAGDTHNIYQSDVLFWMGGDVFPFQTKAEASLAIDSDLNYRLDLPDGEIRNLLSAHASGIDNVQTLLLYDQLKAAMRNNRAFSGFTEPSISHIPTYRLSLGVSKDSLGYDTKRKPAWTDRILYMAPPDMSLVQIAYRSHPEITMSDHYPVSADFNISLPLIDQSRYETAVSALQRELASLEDSEHGPKIKVQPTSIEFGMVGYKHAIEREVIIQNDGDIPCVFRFVGTGTDSESISPSWLRVEPMIGLLRPHEATTVTLMVYVDNDSAAKLNLNPPVLSSTLILHTALGKDDFLAVSGYYQYTCFANTLERLTRLEGPIRKLTAPEDVTSAGQATNAPREIMRLINWTMTHVSAADTLFEHPAQESLCHIIRECLDTGDEFPTEADGDHRALVAAICSTLVLFLDSLVEPVVPARLHAQCLQVKDKDEAFEVLDAFPHESINVWISLSACLHYIAGLGAKLKDESDSGSFTPRTAFRLASLFAPILLRDDPTGVYPRASPVGKRDFLLLFIA